MSGKFITFEGPEGCGKSTQIKLLAGKLVELNLNLLCTREPGGTATGEAIRNILQHDVVDEELDPRSELLLFTASRAQLMSQVIRPALDQGTWVLCDRFIDSTMAYQGFARGMNMDALDQINDFAIGGRKPDLTLLLDIDIDSGFDRLRSRYADGKETHDRFEREAREFHQQVRAGYHKLVAREPKRFRVIDAGKSIDDVSKGVWDAVQEALL